MMLVIPSIADIAANCVDKNNHMIGNGFFMCKNYRSCLTNFDYAINYKNTYYVCFMPTSPKYLVGIRTDGSFTSTGMNSAGETIPNTTIDSTSFVEIFNLQVMNIMTIEKMTSFCVRYQ